MRSRKRGEAEIQLDFLEGKVFLANFALYSFHSEISLIP